MATKQRFRNVDVILDRVQKGEISSESSVFSHMNIQFHRRKEVVKPYLHWLDERSLKKGMDHFFRDKEVLFNKVQQIYKKKNLSVNVIQKIVNEMYDAYSQKKIPQAFQHDLFNFYYTHIENLDFEPQRVSNLTTFRVLESMNQPSMKILSNSNPMKTMLLTRTLIMNFLFSYALRKIEQDAAADSLMDQIQKSSNNGLIMGVGTGTGKGKGTSGSQGTAGAADPGNGPPPPGPPKASSGASSSGSGNPGSPSQGQDSGVSTGNGQEDPLQEDPELPPPGDDLQENEEMQDGNEHGEGEEEQEDGDSEEVEEEQGADDSEEGDEEQEEEDKEEGEEEEGDPYPDATASTPSPEVQEDQADNQQQSDTGSFSGGGIGKAKGTSKTPEQLADELINRVTATPEAVSFSKEALQEVRKLFIHLDQTMSQPEQEALWGELANVHDPATVLDKLDPDVLKQIAKELQSIRLNMNGVKKVIRHLLDKTLNYFSSKEEPFFEDLWDTDNLDGLDDWELLHPLLRNISLNDIMVRNSRKIGKIDIYGDISGSMDGPSGMVDDRSKMITCAQFAKAVIYKMKEMDLLDQLYSFDEHVHHLGNTLSDILTLGGDGGTDINKVVRMIMQTEKNSLVITDGQDECSLYHPQVFFLAVAGGDFSEFEKEVLEQYIAQGQLCIFDGTRTYQVGMDGLPIR